MNKLFIFIFVMTIPSMSLLILGVYKGIQAMKEEQKNINFEVELKCEKCGHQFSVPLHVYGKHLWSKSSFITRGGSLNGMGGSISSIRKESRKVWCPNCQKEVYCRWSNIADFPSKYHLQITLAMVKGLGWYFIGGFIWVEVVRRLLN